jgi:predicted phage terminase large subunit-like protein
MRKPIDILKDLAALEAQESFWAFRQYINPKMKHGWWQREVAIKLQQFYEEFIAGLKPKLVIEAPPQHGKSVQIIEFIAWLCGHNPDWRVIYTSFSDRLGVRANLRLQRVFDSDKYKQIFPALKLSQKRGDAQRTNDMLEYVGREGFFRNTTVGGSITGESLDIGVIDDPIKGREAAGSPTIRDKTWEWFTDDFFTRFGEEGALLAILTRWHIDDPIGRLIQKRPEIKVLKYPAIAIQDEEHRKIGEALFPQHKSVEFLLERKATLTTSSWESLYQQNPIIIGGNLIRGEWFPRLKVCPIIKHRVIYVDTAQKVKQHNDYSVFECWGKMEDGRIVLLDLLRGKWEAPDLRRAARDFWNKHRAMPNVGALRVMKIEDKVSGTGLIQEFNRTDRIPVEGIERNIDKLTRVMDVASFIESGYVCLLEESHFINDFINECEAFAPNDSHQYDDQIDPMCDAINDLLAARPKGFFDMQLTSTKNGRYF